LTIAHPKSHAALLFNGPASCIWSVDLFRESNKFFFEEWSYSLVMNDECFAIEQKYKKIKIDTQIFDTNLVCDPITHETYFHLEVASSNWRHSGNLVCTYDSVVNRKLFNNVGCHGHATFGAVANPINKVYFDLAGVYGEKIARNTIVPFLINKNDTTIVSFDNHLLLSLDFPINCTEVSRNTPVYLCTKVITNSGWDVISRTGALVISIVSICLFVFRYLYKFIKLYKTKKEAMKNDLQHIEQS